MGSIPIIRPTKKYVQIFGLNINNLLGCFFLANYMQDWDRPCNFEYFDLDIEGFKKRYPDIRYCILCDNVYTGTGFNNCICRAGFMMRDIVDSGEVFEPKTVQSSFAINCDSNFAYLFAIDLEKRKPWLPLAL